MDRIMSADEVFAVGVEIEKNGKAFYLAAADKAAGEPVRKLLTDLGAWENSHIELFEKLRANLPAEAKDENLYDPNDEIALYLKATADYHVFIQNNNMEELAAGCTSVIDILNLAISFEKDSVVFYSAIREAVGEGKAEVEKIIREELTHISFLTRELQKAKA